MRSRFVSAARRLADTEPSERAVALLRRILDDDPFDEPSHLALVKALHVDGRHGESTAAHAAYVTAMTELGVPAAEWEVVTGG
jgi:DNA-binding SARP family transcriptional activator